MNNNKYKQGYTLVEALIYIAVFVILSFAVMSLLLSVMETNRKSSPINALSRGATSALEIITREIRGATSLDALNSDFATSSGRLSLNSLDASDNPRTVMFYLESGQVKIQENGVYIGPLSPSDVAVTALYFNLATSTGQSLLKIELDMSAGSGNYQKSDKFYSSVSLRTDN